MVFCSIFATFEAHRALFRTGEGVDSRARGVNAIATINRAFELFQVGEERAGSIRGHWNGYFANYDGYIENLQL